MKLRLTQNCLLRTTTLFICAAWIAALAATGFAADVDYEGEALGAVPPATTLVFEGPLYVSALGDSEIEDGLSCAPMCPDNGTQYQLSHGFGFGGAITITADADPDACTPNCNLFDLFEIDVAEPIVGAGPIGLIIYGETTGGVIEPFDFVTDGIVDGVDGEPDFETVVLPDTFHDLDGVLIISAAPYLGVAIDNLQFAPEPAAWATLGSGSAVLAVLRRRRRRFGAQ